MTLGYGYGSVRVVLAAMAALGIIGYIAALPGERITAQERETGTPAATAATTTPPTLAPTGDLVVVPEVVQVGSTTLAVGLHIDPPDLEASIEYSEHFAQDGEPCISSPGATPRAFAPTWVTLKACRVGDGYVRLIAPGTGSVIEEVSVRVTHAAATGQAAPPSVTLSGVTSSRLRPGGTGDGFSVRVTGLGSAGDYVLHTVPLNGSSAAFDRGCSNFMLSDPVSGTSVTRSYTVYGCIPPGTRLWSYLDLNGATVSSSDLTEAPFVNVENPTASFSSSSYSVDEADEATITVDLSHQSHSPITVPITVSNGTAESGDYTVSGLSGGELRFASRDTSESFTITARHDDDTSNETVNIRFGSPLSNASAGSPSSATLRILDDDTTPPGRMPSLPSVSNRIGTVGTAVDVQLPAATGGDPPLTYSASSLPSGLSFSSDTRRITGTPTATQSETVTYTVTDNDGDIDSTTFTFTIADVPNTLGRPSASDFSTTSIRISWVAPAHNNSPLTGYTLRYQDRYRASM